MTTREKHARIVLPHSQKRRILRLAVSVFHAALVSVLVAMSIGAMFFWRESAQYVHSVSAKHDFGRLILEVEFVGSCVTLRSAVPTVEPGRMFKKRVVVPLIGTYEIAARNVGGFRIRCLRCPTAAFITALLFFPILSFALGPFRTALRKRRRANRHRRGNCESCGYNLTGNTTGICPECGRTFDLRANRIQ